MEFDLEIISEEGDNPDPLFSSIINAMNSMKEATADKIYQKIQREGATNYSKPQVDRALASALKYGIFEVKNNRYRVRDDILDDVDTVYWKMQRKREQTPFRIPEGINERHLGPKLDPEKDNLRFKKISDTGSNECPQCGRTKKTLSDKKNEAKQKVEKKDKRKVRNPKQDANSKGKKRRPIRRSIISEDESYEEFRTGSKRKFRSASMSDDKRIKKRRLAQLDADLSNAPNFLKDIRPNLLTQGKYDSTDESEIDSTFLSDDEQSYNSVQGNIKNKAQMEIKQLSNFDCKQDKLNTNNMQGKSHTSIKSESEIESSLAEDPSETKLVENITDNLPCTSMNMRIKNQNQYFDSEKLYGREGIDECGRNTNWIDYLDPQGTIIQSDNVLTIEPMDSITFKAPHHTSYIS